MFCIFYDFFFPQNSKREDAWLSPFIPCQHPYLLVKFLAILDTADIKGRSILRNLQITIYVRKKWQMSALKDE
jgi:hypothetical protein